MINCRSLSFEQLLPLVKGDKYWGKYIPQQIAQSSKSVGLHLAIFVEPYLQYILDGRKTVESRFSINRRIPYQSVDIGDVILLKKSSGPVLGVCHVSYVSFYRLDESSWHAIKKEFTDALCAQDPQFWNSRKNASYATLIKIDHVKEITPFYCNKLDRRGWVVLKGKEERGNAQLFLFQDEQVAKEEHDSSKIDCSRGLHAFLRSPLVNQSGNPRCRWCGADCVDWPSLHKHDRSAVLLAIRELRKELWRDSWFKREIDVRAKNHALRKGKRLLRVYAENRIHKSVGSEQPYRDGFQTPFKGNVIYYAQHAVAACCRDCIEVWHGIPKGKKLTEEEIIYLVELVMQYVDTVMLELTEEGIHVPPIRKPQDRRK